VKDTTIQRIHPSLKRQIDLINDKLSEELGMITKNNRIPTKLIADHLERTNFVQDIEILNVRPKKQKRRETLFDIKL